MGQLENFATGVGERINTEKFCYHYTSLETAIECILALSTIKFSPLKEVNDPKESNVNDWMGGGIPSDRTKQAEYIEIQKRVGKMFHERVKVFCACRDRPEAKSGFDRGHIKPRMWAHYGQNGRGVCLVFKKLQLIDIAKAYSIEHCVSGNVEYTDDGHLMLPPDERETAFKETYDYLVKKRFLNSSKELLYTKHLDWEAENEFRIAILDKKPGSVFLDIRDSLEAIIVGHDFPEPYCPVIRSYADSRGIYAGRLKWNGGSISHVRISSELNLNA